MNKNCCRICLSGNESQLVELFWVDAGVTYADKVRFCSGIEVLKKDNLPQKICFDCSDSVRSACDIKRKCIETDRLLRSQFKTEPCYAESFDELSVFCLPVLGDTQDAQPSPEEAREKGVVVKTEVSSDDGSDCYDAGTVSSSEDEVPLVKRKTKARAEKRSAVKRLCKNCGSEFKIQQIMFVDAKDVFCSACQQSRKSSKDSKTNLQYKCEICPNVLFQYESTLKKHEEILHPNKPFKTLMCGLCDFTTRYKVSLQEHVRKVHESGDQDDSPEFTPEVPHAELDNMKKSRGRPEDKLCLFCGRVFTSVRKRKDHLKEKHSKELECKTCHAKKPSVFAVETCMKIHLFGHRYLCTVCAKGFSKEGHLKRHERQVHFKDLNLGKTFYCDLCGHHTKRKECIREHVLRHTKAGNKKFPCPHASCEGVAYSLLNALNRHLYLNHGVVAPLSCPVCFTGFTYNFEITKHLKHCSGVAKQPKVTTRVKKDSLYEFFKTVGDKFHCKLCLRIFDSENKFNFHYNETHRDGKTCNLCGKSFKSIDHRNKHIKIIHNKIKDYNCDHPGCGKSFGTIFVLQEHQNTHTGLRPFPCTYCDFTAGSRSTQYKHIRRKHKFEMQRDQEQSTSTFQRFP